MPLKSNFIMSFFPCEVISRSRITYRGRKREQNYLYQVEVWSELAPDAGERVSSKGLCVICFVYLF